jgi:hypothetical protein
MAARATRRRRAKTSVSTAPSGQRVLAQQTFSSVSDCQEPFERWRHAYNHERPHEALRLAVPASRYRPSPRALPTALPPITYAATDIVRRVQDSGRFSYQGHLYRLSRALRGYPIALRANGQQGPLGVWFCTHQLGTLDPHRRTLEASGREGISRVCGPVPSKD